MEDISLHILDIAENSVRAEAKNIWIELNESEDEQVLVLKIINDGKMMSCEECQKALDPFYSTKSGKQTGFGLALLAQSAEQTGGSISLESKNGKTMVIATFNLKHPDMLPMGDINSSLVALITGNPHIRYVYSLMFGDRQISYFDSHALGNEILSDKGNDNDQD